ncbi:4128_t:CDS:1 [Dentiscutata heterogama]|uniref:4128_t:CDS:1 n=1 Tax=Dentiscutata heterogama TaxID=1316150 RepID=A0ACA9JX64_9GLOM|nr:4128_t:CDS:1 [Dentiscutata heterogama]
MSQPTVQIISVQIRNNSGQLLRSQIIGGPQNANGQFQRALNIGMLPTRSQNTANLSSDAFIAVQQHMDLISGTYPFTRIQGIENTQPSQSTRFSTMLFSGSSFP